MKYIKKGDGKSGDFSRYVTERLEENIHPERLLNLANYTERFEETEHLSSYLNRAVAKYLIGEHKGYDHLYYMLRHDTRQERHIRKPFFQEMAEAQFDTSFKIIETLAHDIGTDKHSLLLEMLDAGHESRRLLHLHYCSKLSPEDLLEIELRALAKNSNMFFVLFESSEKLRLLVAENIHRDNDKDKFAIALQNTNLPMESLESSFSFGLLIRSHGKDMPETLEKLYLKAEKEERWEFLLTLGSNRNKKELLRSIVKAKDTHLIDKFFSLYKNYPEVKHLTPFI